MIYFYSSLSSYVFVVFQRKSWEPNFHSKIDLPHSHLILCQTRYFRSIRMVIMYISHVKTDDKVTLKSIKQNVVDLLTSITDLTHNLSKIIVEYLEFEPTNILQTLKTAHIFDKVCEGINDVSDKDMVWVITENEKNNTNNKTRTPLLSVDTITALYYYSPKRLQNINGDIDYTLIGKHKSNTEFIYFMLNMTELYTIGNISCGFIRHKLIYSSTWNGLYLYGLTNDALRLKCYQKHWFT